VSGVAQWKKGLMSSDLTLLLDKLNGPSELDKLRAITTKHQNIQTTLIPAHDAHILNIYKTTNLPYILRKMQAYQTSKEHSLLKARLALQKDHQYQRDKMETRLIIRECSLQDANDLEYRLETEMLNMDLNIAKAMDAVVKKQWDSFKQFGLPLTDTEANLPKLVQALRKIQEEECE